MRTGPGAPFGYPPPFIAAGAEGAFGMTSAAGIAGMFTSIPCFFACAASALSAASPCRSPLPSFLYAYCTVISLFMRYCPCMFAIASSDASKEAYEMNPYPFERLASSLLTFGGETSGPKREKVS